MEKQQIIKIIEQNEKIIYALANKYNIHGYTKEDLIQEGYVVSYQGLLKYDPTKKAKHSTFIYLCVERHFVKLLRKAQNQSSKIIEYNDFINYNKSEEPLEKLILAEKLEELNYDIKHHLSDLEREVINKSLAGKKYQEIAKEMNMTPKKIDNALNRAKNKLKKRSK